MTAQITSTQATAYLARWQEVNRQEAADLRIPRVEDLMIMRAVAQRPQDLLDLEGLIAAHPEADLAMVRRWVAEFSTAATMPSLLEEFDRLSGRLGR